jgi:hypothetical protein
LGFTTGNDGLKRPAEGLAETQQSKKEVWSREEKYWKILTALDREGYIRLWDESRVDWPYPLPDPIRRDFIRSDPIVVGVQLNRRTELLNCLIVSVGVVKTQAEESIVNSGCSVSVSF